MERLFGAAFDYTNIVHDTNEVNGENGKTYDGYIWIKTLTSNVINGMSLLFC